jgi:hypothetical protein
MHKKSEKKDEIDDKKVAVPPVTRAVPSPQSAE